METTTSTSDATRDDVLVRSTWHAVAVPGASSPHDVAHLKVYYPAISDVTEDVSRSGEMGADRSSGPLPVVFFLSGINCSQDSYRWLAIELVRAGFAVVTYDHVSELTPGYIGLSPGMDFAAFAPDVYGTRPTCSALPALTAKVAELNADGPLAGMFDLDRIALGGHSGGGTLALQSANPDLVPGARAVFSYAAHTVTSAMLPMHPAGTVLPCGSGVAVLLMSGTEDGVVAGSAGMYGEHGADPVAATFEHGVAPSRAPGQDAWFVELKGANHFAIGTHDDPTASRGFLDGIARVPAEQTRETLVEVVTAFLRDALMSDVSARDALERIEASPPPTISLIRRHERRAGDS